MALKSSKNLSIAFLLASASAFPQFTLAAEAADGGAAETETTSTGTTSADAELVVTGRRDDRNAQIQQTPVSITSLSGDKLVQQGITTVRELGNIVPNLYQSRTAVSYLNATFYLRGIGESDAQGEPSVPVYLDGIYVPKTLGSQSELLDIDRVEVLRGPQGQSFGHSAAGGAILISSTVPDDTTRIKAQAGYGNYNDIRAGLALSGPIAGGVYGGAAVSYHRRDGFNTHVSTGRGVNTVDYLAGRVKLRFIPSDDLDILLSASVVHDNSTARGVQDLLRPDRDVYNQIFPFQKFDQRTASLQITYDIDDRLKLKSLSAFYHFKQHVFFDNTGDFYGRGSQLVKYRDTTWQQDLQLIGDFDAVDFTAGLYLYREEWFTNRRANTAAAPATSVPSAIRYRPVFTLIQQNTDNVAGYAQAAVHLNQALTVTGGLRYNRERHSQDNQLFNLVATTPFQSTAANFLDVIHAPAQALVWSVDQRKSWDTWSPRLSIDYRVTPEVLGYATVSRGTKSAGYDYRAQAASEAGRRQSATPFDPEIVTNYEIGLKTEWLGGRLRANISAFHIDFDDVQITATDPAPPDGGGAVSRRFNAGKGSTRGVEVEGSAIPVDGLQLDFNASYLKARLDKFTGVVARTTYPANPANTIFPAGFVLNNSPFDGALLPNSPKWQARFAATWQLPLPTLGKWTVNGDVNFQSTSYTTITNNFSELLPAQTYFNAQVTYVTKDEHWSFAASARNLTNRHYALAQGYVADTAGLPIYRTTNYNDPRTVLFTITYRQ
jgi:iron complex outermembrane receptor protein